MNTAETVKICADHTASMMRTVNTDWLNHRISGNITVMPTKADTELVWELVEMLASRVRQFGEDDIANELEKTARKIEAISL